MFRIRRGKNGWDQKKKNDKEKTISWTQNTAKETTTNAKAVMKTGH